MFQLIQKDRFLTPEEKKIFEDFAMALDIAIVNQYSGVLQDLKVFFIKHSFLSSMYI